MSISTTAAAAAGGRVRAGIIALVAGIALFGLGQVVHGPEVSPTRDLAEFVAAMSSARLAVAHLLLAGAATLLIFGSAAVYFLLAPTRSERSAFAGFVTTSVGAVLVVLGLGAAVLAYPDVAASYGQAPEAIGPVLEGGVRVLAVLFTGAGLLVLGGVLVAVAVWRCQRLPRARAVPYALSLPLVLATENAPTPMKAVVAVVITAAAGWLATALWRTVDEPHIDHAAHDASGGRTPRPWRRRATPA